MPYLCGSSGRAESFSGAPAAHATRTACRAESSSVEICLVIECKPPCVIRSNSHAAIPDLVSTNAGRLKEAIRQVVEYIKSKKTGYAILSSEDVTYFLRVGDLRWSRAPRFLPAIHYILFLSKDTANVNVLFQPSRITRNQVRYRSSKSRTRARHWSSTADS